MRKRLFNDKWEFIKTPVDEKLATIRNSEDLLKAVSGCDIGCKEMKTVSIPHDWLIYNGKDLYEDGIGWYRRVFNTDELLTDDIRYSKGNRIFLNFDGVYMNSIIYINGVEAFIWKYGYSAFEFEITDYLNDGDNEILVKVVHESPNSRWYSGAGIFRDVTIRVTDNVFIPDNGIYVSYNSECGQDFDLHIETEIVNADENTRVQYAIEYVDKNSCAYGLHNISAADISDIKNQANILGETFVNKATDIINNSSEYDICSVAKESDSIYLLKSDFEINSPKLWDINSPNLYRLCTYLYQNDELIDVYETTIGFKTVKYTVNDGFYLNGKRIKLQGVCEHHDFGCIGSAFYEDAIRRKFTMLKKMGVNALRTSHNMPASILMDVADEMGIMVVSEAFDMWARKKTEYDYARFFNEWVDKDVRSWIKRDRNHPSIIMWSIGNEIYDTHAGEEGLKITEKLLSLVKKYDPYENGRATLGSNYMPWENTQKCADLYKLAGYNYGAKYYEEHHKKHPDYIIYGSETGSVVMSRGVYHFPFSQQVLADEDEQCSALGNSNTSWGAKSIEHCIADDRDVPYSLGQFVWTGFDYIGEPTPYHTRNSYFGLIDTAGFPKDAYYVFMAEWTDAKSNPMVHIFPYWDFNAFQNVDIRICSNGASVELFVNDESVGKKTLNHEQGRDFTATFTVPYVKGNITAVAYDLNGNEIARSERVSFSDSKKIVLKSDKKEILADGRSLAFVEISTVDENNNPVENAMDYVEVNVTGNGYLLGLDNGDSTDFDEYKSSVRKLFNGKLLAVILSEAGEGAIEVSVNGDGLIGDSLSIETIKCDEIKGIPDKKVREKDSLELLVRKNDATRIPARKVELLCKNGSLSLTKENPSALFEAKVYPENSTDKTIIFKAVNDSGIEISYVNLEMDATNQNIVNVTAKGDGDFWLRAMSADLDGKIHLISQVQIKAEGLGKAYINPYEFVAGGLYTRTFGTGEIGNGNEKGFSTWFEGASSACFDNIDFGETGSDELMMPIFCLSNEGFPFKIYEGTPEDGEVILDSVYQQNYIWNVYQEGTFKLNKRLKGITSISIEFYSKVHIKGFKFKKFEKAFEQISATNCDKIYGDSFVIEEDAVTGIGNNVTLEYENMNFGDSGVRNITICGKSELDINTIHIRFFDENGDEEDRIVEFKGSLEYVEQSFEFDSVYGNKKVNFVFLPGCNFDFKYFIFNNK